MTRLVSRKDFLCLGGMGVVGAMLLGTMGCGGNRGEVVNFLDATRETTLLERAQAEIIAGFEDQNPNTDIQREAMSTEEVRTDIEARLRSAQSPDVFTYDTGPGFGGVLADAGLLYSLEEAYTQNDWKIYEWAKERATYNGTVYGVPTQIEEIIVYYNKDLVPQEPKTVEELREIAAELRERGIIPFAFGDQEQWPAGHMFSIGVSNVLGREGLDNILYGEGRWDTDEVITTIDLMFRDFVESGYYPEGVNTLTYDGANTLFYSAKAAMLPTGTWLVPEIVQTVQDFEVGFFPFPSINGSSVSPPVGVGSGLFVAADAKNPEGAISFLDYLQQEDTANLIIEKTNTIPAYPVDMERLNVPELFKQVLDDLSESPQAEALGYNIDVLAPQSFNEAMFSGFQGVIDGWRSPEEQAAALQQAWVKAKEAGDMPVQE